MQPSISMRSVLLVLTGLGLLLPATGCDPVREPWVRDPDQLAQERARPEQADEALRHRLHAVQTDR